MVGRIWVAAAAVLALAATGCGGSEEAAAPAPGAGPARMVQHAMGVTEISGTPQRVVVLDTGELDSVLALGVTPVGSVVPDADAELPAYLGDRVQGIEPVGTIGEPNLEAIATLQPDLILSNKVRDETVYDQLSGIAPTVFAENVGVSWKENFLLAGEALGKRAQAEQILSDYGQQATETGRAFGDPAQVAVSMVRVIPGSIRLYGEGSFIGTILSDAGFGRPPSQQVDETFVEVSQEQLGQAEGDLLFYAAFGTDGAQELVALTAGPLWQRLPAVAQQRAYPVPDDLWYLGIGPIAAGLVLDDLAEYAPAG